MSQPILRRTLWAFALFLSTTALAQHSLAAVHSVHHGDSIQDAVNAASPGDEIRVFPGTYTETVYIDKDHITLTGVVEGDEWPNLDGGHQLNDAILYSGNNVTVSWFKITHFKGNAIMGQAGNNFSIRNNWIVDTGVYGIFPEFGKNGVIENNVLSGIEDAAIYVGMSDHIDVRNNLVFDNVAGIEIENSRHVLVEGNVSRNNTGGILVFITPGLPIKTSYDAIIRRNVITDNNTPNFGIPGSLVATIPAGSGVIVMAGDEVIIEDNIISGNNTGGIIVTSLDFVTEVASDTESDPHPDRIQIRDNVMFNNGNAPEGDMKLLMLTKFSRRGPDILAYQSAADRERGSCISRRTAYRVYGVDEWADCDAPAITANLAVIGREPADSTRALRTKMLPQPAEPREIRPDPAGAELVYQGICAGCHAYNVRMIGPPTLTIQALYGDDAAGIADYIAAPTRKRDDFPAMPPQGHLSADMRRLVAEYMLSLTQ